MLFVEKDKRMNGMLDSAESISDPLIADQNNYYLVSWITSTGLMDTCQKGAAEAETEQSLTQTVDSVNHASISSVLAKENQTLLLFIRHQLVVNQANFLFKMDHHTNKK